MAITEKQSSRIRTSGAVCFSILTLSLHIWVSYAFLKASSLPDQSPLPSSSQYLYSIIPIRPLLYITVLEKRDYVEHLSAGVVTVEN